MTTTQKSLHEYCTLQPGKDQLNALQLMEKFIQGTESEDVFILRGSAGTGKTTLTQALSAWLSDLSVPCYLAAPTGRAAKIISSKTGRIAKTIHSLIYIPEQGANGISVVLKRKMNPNQKACVFIIDEASMISDLAGGNDKFIASKSLLDDLISYVKEGNKESKIIFIGDRFQLPPIHSTFSPALDPEYLRKKHKLKVAFTELTEVVRHQQDSYILKNACNLRSHMEGKYNFYGLELPRLSNSTQALQTFQQYEIENKHDQVALIAFTNRDVNWFNSAYRILKYKKPNILMPGDSVFLNQNWSGNGNFF
ncbi:MAG: AAA family ATPase [Bacteroidetes bacterium]|nr:AAA family ATPase [Bacteroidota bacterium]